MKYEKSDLGVVQVSVQVWCAQHGAAFSRAQRAALNSALSSLNMPSRTTLPLLTLLLACIAPAFGKHVRWYAGNPDQVADVLLGTNPRHFFAVMSATNPRVERRVRLLQ